MCVHYSPKFHEIYSRPIPVLIKNIGFKNLIYPMGNRFRYCRTGTGVAKLALDFPLKVNVSIEKWASLTFWRRIFFPNFSTRCI